MKQVVIPQGQYPGAFYRVSAKAVIRDTQNRVLMVEDGGSFDLPGGGVEHGENFKQTLVREFVEEIGVNTSNFEYQLLGVETTFKPKKDAWLMNIVCEVQFAEAVEFSVGADADGIRFMSKQELAKCDNIGAKIAYKYAFNSQQDIKMF